MWKRWSILLLIIASLSVLIAGPRLFAPPRPSGIPENIEQFSLAGYQRLLVVAPHCDDETLGAAGLMLAAERAGMQVRVVIETNGDGFYFATSQDFHTLRPDAVDYIRMGEIRQGESLAAMKILGIQENQVIFLGYPDRGTPSEWNDHWSVENPYRSPYSQDTHSPYSNTYDHNSVYSGEDLLKDISSIIESYRPDLIVYPNPDDVHPDHWGMNAFTRLSIAETNHVDPSYQPTELTYLVHRPDFPTIRGLKPKQSLVPPPALLAVYPRWVRWDLTPEDVQKKGLAVQAYKSQLPLLHGLLESFVRSNELYAMVNPVTLVKTVQGNQDDPSTWVDVKDNPISPVERDPIGDFFVRRAFPSADLVAAYFTIDNSNTLWICSQARDETAFDLTYQLRIKALSGNSVTSFSATTGKQEPGWVKATRNGVFTCAQTRFDTLGIPWGFFIGSDVVGGGQVLDQTGWQLVTLPSSP
jgi:LmbE family N-acetylglucosaminyl deacetylase